MAVSLNPVTSGYSTGVINNNFQQIEDLLNNNFLQRDGLDPGDPNQMELDLDMNGFDILNIGYLRSTDGTPYVTEATGDARYVNVEGDTMLGSLNMANYPIVVRLPIQGDEPARKDQLDQERSERFQADQDITSGYQQGDANLQEQLTGNVPLEASAFSPISWHDQSVDNSVAIPDNKNAWSFGPAMSVSAGQAVTIGSGSFWTIANGEIQ